MASHSIGYLLVIIVVIIIVIVIVMFCFDWWLLLFVAVVKHTSKLLLLIFILILLLSLLRFYLLLQFSGIETTSIFIMDSAHSTFLNLLFGTCFLKGFPLFLQNASYLQGLDYYVHYLGFLIGGSTCCPWSCTRCWGWSSTSCKWMVPFCNICHKSCVAIGSGWPGGSRRVGCSSGEVFFLI